MLGIEEAIVAHLLAAPAVAGLVGKRVQTEELNEKSEMPAIAIRQASRDGVHSTEGPSGLAAVRFHFDIWSKRRLEARRLSDAVRTALDGFAGKLGGSIPVSPALLEDEASVFDNELKLHGFEQMWVFWVNESIGG